MSARGVRVLHLLPLLLGASAVAGVVVLHQRHQKNASQTLAAAPPTRSPIQWELQDGDGKRGGIRDVPAALEGLEDLWQSYVQALRERRIGRAYLLRDQMLKRVPGDQCADLERQLKEIEGEEQRREDARRHLPKGAPLPEQEARELAIRLSRAAAYEEIDALFAQMKEREMSGTLAPELVEIISRTPNLHARKRLIELLNNIADPESARALAVLFEPSWPREVRFQALHLLRNHRGEDPLGQDLYIRLFRSESDEDLREHLVCRLDSRNPESRSILRSLLADGNTTVRSVSVGALDVESPDDRKTLIEVLNRDPSPNVRYHAILELERADPAPTEIVGALAWAVQHDPSDSTRGWLIRALDDGQFRGNPTVRNALEAVVQTDPEPQLRDEASRVLKRLFDQP